MKFLRAKLCNSVGQKRNARWFIHQWREFKRWQDLDRASKEYKEVTHFLRSHLDV